MIQPPIPPLIRVLLVEYRHLQREGFGAIIEREPDMAIAAEAGDGIEALELLESHRPEVALVSAELPGPGVVAAVRGIARIAKTTSTVVVAEEICEALERDVKQAGAMYCLSGNFSAADLVRAVRNGALAAGRDPRGVAEKAARWSSRSKSGPHKLLASRLTPREREVLCLLADGWSTRRIAERLHISVKTVETHRANLCSKLDLRSLAELTKFAVLAGLTSLESRPGGSGEARQ